MVPSVDTFSLLVDVSVGGGNVVVVLEVLTALGVVPLGIVPLGVVPPAGVVPLDDVGIEVAFTTSKPWLNNSKSAIRTSIEE